MISALIVDDNSCAREELRSMLYMDSEIDVVAEAADGLDAEDKILEFMPQIVLIDLVMPRLDGIGLIRRIKSRHDFKVPVFIMFSNSASEQTIKTAFDIGADYFYLRPFEAEEIIYAIKETCRQKKRLMEYDKLLTKSTYAEINDAQKDRRNYKTDINSILFMYGISSGINGYHYLRRAIEIALEDNTPAKLISKKIYYNIAKEYNTTYAGVERGIRYAIESGFKNKNTSLPNELSVLKSSPRRLKNFQFIDFVSDYLRR